MCPNELVTRKAGTVHLGARKHIANSVVHDLKANVFSLSIAVEPQDKSSATPGYPLEVSANPSLGIGLLLSERCGEEISWVDSFPVLIGSIEICSVKNDK